MRGMATIEILFEGYLSREGDDRVGSTVGLIQDGEVVAVVDPGLVPSPLAILDPLARLGFGPAAVTDVVFSHHHPDHTLNAALFPRARFHDHWAIYQGDLWTSRDAEGFELSPDVFLIRTPGHSPEDISTLARTEGGLVVFTHAWWAAEVPVEDPFAPDPAVLHRSRTRLLDLEPALVVPGHGAPFRPGPSTPP
jgi:glyoxylase-like metal-dependent hydrolase (beta-lactamase superfamily II)